jgi:PAS domain-containing protein
LIRSTGQASGSSPTTSRSAPRRPRDAKPEERFLDFIYEPVTDATGQISGIFCEGHDVTEAHLVEEALRASEQELLLLADALPVLVSYMDAEVRYDHIGCILHRI